jgi:hypothetical protein
MRGMMNFKIPFLNKSSHVYRMISDSRIEIQFDVETPIDLVDLTLAFTALSRQYKKFVMGFIKEKELEIPDEDSVRLFVTRIESNCIIAELGWVDTGPLLLTAVVLMDKANTIQEFLKNLSFYIHYFQDKLPFPQGKQPGKRDSEDYKDLLNPVAKAGNGSLKLKELKYDKEGKPKSLFEMEYVSDQAVKAIHGIDDHIKQIEATADADHKSVLMYLESVEQKIQKPDAKRTRDYGVIESLFEKPLPVFWLSEMDAQKVKNYDGNPFKCSFMVDANIETKHGEPRAYRIVKLHEIIADEP